MSKIFILTAALFSFSALADVPAFWPKQVTCEELQASLEQYGQIGIRIKYLLGSDVIATYKDEPNCGSFQYSSKMKVRTSDGIKCRVGWYCEDYTNP